MIKTIYLIRHGEPAVIGGKKGDLTKKGIAQARAVAKQLGQQVELADDIAVHYSPVERCQQTAKIIGQQINQPIYKAPLRLKGADSIAIRETQSKLGQYLSSYRKLSVESPEEFTHRITDFIHQQTVNTLVFVGNEVPIRLLMGKSPETNQYPTIKHGELIKIRMDDHGNIK